MKYISCSTNLYAHQLPTFYRKTHKSEPLCLWVFICGLFHVFVVFFQLREHFRFHSHLPLIGRAVRNFQRSLDRKAFSHTWNTFINIHNAINIWLINKKRKAALSVLPTRRIRNKWGARAFHSAAMAVLAVKFS